MCCVASTAQVWVTGGDEQARFIARNAECLQCHVELIPDFSRNTVHNPFAQKQCTTCHTRHGKKVSVSVTRGAVITWRRWTRSLYWLPLKWWFNLSQGSAEKVSATAGGVDQSASVTRQIRGGKSKLTMPEEQLCWMCHGDLGPKRDDPFQHQPFQASRCTNCHDPHASDFSALLTQAPNKICLTCHPIGAELTRAQTHPPVKQGWCTDCHDPHASEFRGILVARQRELCFRCHPSVAGKSGMAVQHVPFLNDNCTGCHEPHGSDYLPLLIAEQPQLCYDCHPIIRNQFAARSHHPIGVDLKCASCHDAHAAPYAGLLTEQTDTFCYRCHGEFKANFEPTAHVRIHCTGCHTPHGSDYWPILRASNPPLCLSCHGSNYDDRVTSNRHPVWPVDYDVNAQAPLTCTSSCHNPHGSKYDPLLRYWAIYQDGRCLMCHAVTRGDRVGIDF